MGEIRPNNASGGLNLDATTSQVKPGQLTFAQNAVVEGFDGNQITYQNEQANEPCATLPDGFSVIGRLAIIERGIVVYWLVNTITNKSEIGVVDTTTCIYTTKINPDCLAFNINFPILKAVYKITACGTEVYWTDANNSRRFLDLDNLPFVQNIEGCNDNTTTEIDCNKLNVQPNFKIPQIAYEEVDSEGTTIAGAYQFAIQYCNSLGDPYTSYYSVTDPISITDPLKVTLDFNYVTGKAIKLNITNIETSGVFDYYNIAVIKTINNITSVDLVATYQIRNSAQEVIYTGQSKAGINLTINDIFEKFVIFDKAGDVEAVQDILVWDDLTTEERVSYQKIANKIKLQWETVILPYTSKQYKDPLLASNYRGYMRDEVYPFELCLMYTNGYQTDGFHIPGRSPNDNDLSLVDNLDVLHSTSTCDDTLAALPRWQVYNTAQTVAYEVELCSGTQTVAPPVSSTSQINGTVSILCSDLGCTEQGDTSLVFTFDSPTPIPLNLQIGQITNSSGILYTTGTDFYTAPPGTLPDPYYLDGSLPIAHLPFIVNIPAGSTSFAANSPIFLQGYSSGPRTSWQCHSCDFPIIALYFKPVGVTNYTLTLTNAANVQITVIQDVTNPDNPPVSNPPPAERNCVDNCYLGPYQYGEFAYWESTEVYPCNEAVWGELQGKPIRHHRFPDNEVTNHFDALGNVFPLGVRVDVGKIWDLIQSSPDLTPLQKSKIAGFKILRGDRANNKSIVAKGILYNVGEYFKEGAAYFYPNYPFNDLRLDPFIASQSNSPIAQIIISDTSSSSTIGSTPTVLSTESLATNDLFQNLVFNYSGLFANSSSNRDIQVTYNGSLIFDSNTFTAQTGSIWSLKITTIDHGTHVIAGDVYHDIEFKGTLAITGTFVTTINNDITIPVLANLDATSPLVLSARGVNTGDITLLSLTISTQPHKPQVGPLDGFGTDDSKKRFTFHSPDTSFYQPFLGDILKLEEVLYGNALSHFVEVKDHARYKFPSLASYLTSVGIGVIVGFASGLYGTSDQPFDGAAMFTTVQFLNDLIYKLIPRKNFAYQYDAVGTYNNYKIVENDLGNKIRLLDIASYLIPGVQGVGDINQVNNYQREGSVYLRSTNVLPFPSDIPGVPIDQSRVTISEEGNCSSPGNINVTPISSYYGSIKRPNVDQYGQIFSYPTIDTGAQFFDPTQKGRALVFGGDCFINKFALKRKYPFFLDNRVGQPDDSDIFYDTLGNIGYPTYWFSTDIQKGDGGHFNVGELFGVKVHNFDCSGGNFFYDSGKIYLFAYGIPYFFCESEVNVDYRQAYNALEGDFYPHVSQGIPDNWLQEINVSINNDNTYIYNKSYSKQNMENVFLHLPTDFIPNQNCTQHFPNKAIYSDKQLDVVNYKKNNWLIYRPASQYDFPLNYGRLISLEAIENREIIARFESKTQIYNSLITLDTSNPQAAYIGNDKLFSSAPPVDFGETNTGYVGSQHKFFLKTEYGQITVDAIRGNVYLLSGRQAEDISALSLSKFYCDNLPFQMALNFPGYNIDNHFKGVGLHGVYDARYKRVIITKLDYRPIIKGITYDITTDTFSYKGQKIEFKDPAYFCNVSFTLSFSFLTKTWISFHTYLPNYYTGNTDFFYSGNNPRAKVWRHNTNITVYNNFYGAIAPYTIEYPFTYKKDDEILQSIQDYTKVLQQIDEQSFVETNNIYFNKAIVYNNQQCSGLLNLVAKEMGNLNQYLQYPKYNTDSKDILFTKNDNFYNFNTFWDVTNNVNIPIFIRSCISLSYDKVLNTNNLIYTNLSFRKPSIRAKEAKIRLTLDNRSDVRMISQFILTDNQISAK